MIAAVHDVVSGLALDSLGRLRRRFQHRRVGSVVDVWRLARVPIACREYVVSG